MRWINCKYRRAQECMDYKELKEIVKRKPYLLWYVKGC